MKRLIKTSMLFMVAALFAACANEDIAQDKKKENGTEAPKGGVIFTANGPKTSAKRLLIGDEDEFAGAKTRTNIKHTPGNGADAYWTSDDFIWVKDKNGNWRQSTAITLHDGGASAEFTLPGSKSDYTDGCEVRYTGTQSFFAHVPLAPDIIGFNGAQNRTAANDFSRAGAYGDCGSGRARNTGNPDKFNFTLAHKASYLCFLPRCMNGALAPNLKLRSIKVSMLKDHDNPTGYFTGACNFDGENIASPSSYFSNYIQVSLPDFPLYTTANQEANATYLAVRPGKYDFKIEYTIKDPTTNVETVIKDTRTGITLDKGNIYDVTADLSSFNTNINNPKTFKYYMWDAKQNYWYGYENLQPRFNGVYSERYPKDNHDLRWYNESYPGYGIRNDAQTKFFKTLPNANEIFWYAYNGDPHWVLSKNHLTIINGHLIKQDKVVGVWLKKKAKICHDENITDEQMKNGYPKVNPSDWRKTHGHWPNNIHVNTTPVPNTTDYFFLPAAGYYTDGTLNGLDDIGIYWSSSAHPWFPKCAYFLYFDETELYTYHYRYLCDYGLSAQPFK